jgi:hypothetical protein
MRQTQAAHRRRRAHVAAEKPAPARKRASAAAVGRAHAGTRMRNMGERTRRVSMARLRRADAAGERTWLPAASASCMDLRRPGRATCGSGSGGVSAQASAHFLAAASAASCTAAAWAPDAEETILVSPQRSFLVSSRIDPCVDVVRSGRNDFFVLCPLSSITHLPRRQIVELST